MHRRQPFRPKSHLSAVEELATTAACEVAGIIAWEAMRRAVWTEGDEASTERRCVGGLAAPAKVSGSVRLSSRGCLLAAVCPASCHGRLP